MITKHRILFLIGILIVLIPVLGFPTTYENVFFTLAGLAVAFIAFRLAREKRLGSSAAAPSQVPAPTRLGRRPRMSSVHTEQMPSRRSGASTPLPDISEDTSIAVQPTTETTPVADTPSTEDHISPQ